MSDRGVVHGIDPAYGDSWSSSVKWRRLKFGEFIEAGDRWLTPSGWEVISDADRSSNGRHKLVGLMWMECYPPVWRQEREKP